MLPKFRMSAWGDEYNQPLNGPGGSANDGLKAIGTDMRKISRKIAQLRKDAGQMGTQRDSPELRKQIHRTREEATATMQQVAAALKRSREDPKITGDADQRSSLHQLESDFNQLHQSYSSVLEETQAKMRENTLGPESLSHSQAGARARARGGPSAAQQGEIPVLHSRGRMLRAAAAARPGTLRLQVAPPSDAHRGRHAGRARGGGAKRGAAAVPGAGQRGRGDHAGE